ncbi:uncharacterized protein LOC144101419 isoform X2 [Amblyomma americanum]
MTTRRWGHPPHCDVKFCRSKSKHDATKFHYFPCDGTQRKAWIEFVRATRHSEWMPTKQSRICSRHFTRDCYVQSPALMAAFGLSTKCLRLVRGAVPTIYPTHRTTATSGGSSTAAKPPRQEAPGAADVERVPGLSTYHAGSTSEPAQSGFLILPAPLAAEVSPGSQAVITTCKSDAGTQCRPQVAIKRTQANLNSSVRTVCTQTEQKVGEIAQHQPCASSGCRHCLLLDEDL